MFANRWMEKQIVGIYIQTGYYSAQKGWNSDRYYMNKPENIMLRLMK